MTSATLNLPANPKIEPRLEILVLFDHLKQNYPVKYEALKGMHLDITQSRAFGNAWNEGYKTMYVVSCPDLTIRGYSKLQPSELDLKIGRDMEELAKDGIYLWPHNPERRFTSMKR